MLHVRVDDALKAKVSAALASAGLTPSDAVRILLTRIARAGAPLTGDPDTYDACLRMKMIALPHAGVATEALDVIAQQRRA